jgi:glycosyltransferase involved in cell wall biosynthesis
VSVLTKLQSVGARLCSEVAQVNCRVLEPTPGFSSVPPALLKPDNPLVSCLMMARGHLDLLKYSLTCFQRQTYANRELVVMARHEAGEMVRGFIASQGTSNVSVFVAPPGMTLGDRRNLAAARARGAILMGWDDDDLSDPRRINIYVNALRQTGATAAFLSRLLIWWPQRKIAAISERRPWEASIAAWRSHVPIYAPLSSVEDTPTIEGLTSTHRVILIDCPLLYIYVVTGRNLSGDLHFEGLVSRGDCVFEGDQFDELNALLSDRLPVLDYAAVLHGGTVQHGDGGVKSEIGA